MEKNEMLKRKIKYIVISIILILIFISTGALNLWFIFKKPFVFAIVVFIILSIIALLLLIIFLISLHQTYKNKEDLFEKMFLS